ncbi:sensor domain-containing diguanylate cyclase [Thiohalophilus thiocyanatoxydans]|nr:diguanylate cyclase [Thiohalophilus thiocyanatoxydans]
MILCQRFIAVLLISLLLSTSPRCATAEGGDMPEIEISSLESRLLRDPVQHWTSETQTRIDELPIDAFRPLTDEQVNQGITDRDYWIRFRVSNADNNNPVRWVLHHETSYLDEMSVYYADNDQPLQKVTLSDREPFTERPVDYRTLAFEHTTRQNSYTDLYLRLRYEKPDAMSLNVYLSRADIFYNKSRKEYFLFGTYYGVMGSLLIIALVFASIMRQVVYLYYAVFLASSILMWALLNGFAFQYLWPGSVYWQNEGFHIIFLATAITALQFSRHFLQTARCCPRINKIIYLAQWIMIGGILLRFAGLYTPVLYLSFVSLALLALLPLLGYFAYQYGMRYARWYSIAWLFYGISLVFSVLSAGSNLLSWGMTPLIFTQIGGVLESVFLLIALGERLVGWDRDRLHALEIANKDPLTGLGNRRALEEAFDSLKIQLRSTDKPVFLLMIDLDHFKEINDEYGHDAGDYILQHLARILSLLCRPEDICIRYGGEEFAVLTRMDNVEQACQFSERIRTEFANQPTTYEETPIPHTLTIGVAGPIESGHEIKRAELLRQADAALYRAKQAGRNQTVVYA